MKDLVTVILPVYNGEKYLKRAVESVINQTIGIEKICLIAINDGSQDNSFEILKQYENQFPHSIKVINQANQGVANTRNNAIQLVETPYLTFLDQDDFFDLDFLKILYQAALETGADVVGSGYKRPNQDGKIIKKIKPNVSSKSYGKWTVSAAWAKIHRTQFILEHKIEFYHSKYGEDLPFLLNENQAGKVINIDYIGYNWFFNTESVSNTAHARLTAESQNGFLELIANLINNIERQSEEIDYYLLNTLVFCLLFAKTNNRSHYIFYFNEMFSVLLNYNPKILQNKYLWFGMKGTPLINRLATNVMVRVYQYKMIKFFVKVWCR